MRVDGATLHRLAKLNLPTEAFQEVLSIIGDLQAVDDERRAKQRARTSRSRRSNVTSALQERDGDVTVTSEQRDNTCDSPPRYINPPQEKKPKKVSSIRAAPLPADWSLQAEEREYARSKGWTDSKIDNEADRFRDHALARGRTQKDWRAAWRNWVQSPFQNATAPPARGQPRPGSREDRQERFANVLNAIDPRSRSQADDARPGESPDPPPLRLIPSG